MSNRFCLLACAAVVAGVLSASVRGQQPTAIAEMCWRSLDPETDPRDVGMGIAESMLATTKSGEIWLSRLWKDPSLLRWDAASPSGRIVVASRMPIGPASLL
jgi:hypothetical protein